MKEMSFKSGVKECSVVQTSVSQHAEPKLDPLRDLQRMPFAE